MSRERRPASEPPLPCRCHGRRSRRAPLGAAVLLAVLSGCGASPRSAADARQPSRASVAAVLPIARPIASLSSDELRPERTPAYAYGAIAPEACARELHARRVPFAYVDGARGVNAPIRLTGPLHGVDFHGEPKARRTTSPYEILDCRLALALDDFAKILADHEIVEAVHMSMYRPPPAHITDPTKKRSKHEAALAIDVGALRRRDGTRLSIQEDWHGHIGARTCGSGAGPEVLAGNAVELRSILCETADARLFQVVLTPNNDQRHYNHFHLEVVRGVKWFIVK